MRTTLMMCGLFAASTALAADHAEAPGSSADAAADIADFFAHVDNDTFVGAITFAGLSTSQQGTYDTDVLYTIHIDQDLDAVSDLDIEFRFGQNSAGEWGVQATNLPDISMLMGPVESVLTEGDFKLFAGQRDDPFFFDLQGFNDTLMTGTLGFDSNRDSLAGTNVTAIVFSGPASAISGGQTSIQTWATTARK